MLQREKKNRVKKSFWNCLINVVSSVSGLSLGKCCLLENPVTRAWSQQCWGCFVSLRGRWERLQNRNVLVRGLESASRWHARVRSSGVCMKGWGGEFWNNKTSLSVPDELLWTAFEHDSKYQDFWRGYAR